MQNGHRVTDVVCGCFTMEARLPGRIRQINFGFTKITGYTKEDVNKGIFFPQLIYKEDRKELIYRFKKQFKRESFGCFDYRMIDKNGKIFYAFFWGKHKKDEIHGMFTDLEQDPEISSRIEQINQQWQKKLEPYQIVEQATHEIYFSYSVKDDVMTLPADYAEYLGISERIGKFLNLSLKDLPIYPDDATNYMNILQAACQKPVKGFQEYRLRKISSKGKISYSWRRMYYISLADSNGSVQRILGRITDVDREKQANEELQRKARTDQLTGLYNKITTQHLIRDHLRYSSPEKQHGLMMIDLDHFKKINDYYGHMYGDQVLREVSEKIRTIFWDSDIIGRVGGDEFMVLMKNVSQEITEKKAAELCRCIEKDYRMGEKNIRISCSIGIAMFGEHGTDYDSLYAKADIAMYQAKTLGRNHYMVYAGGKKEEKTEDSLSVDLDRPDGQVLLLADGNEERSRCLEKILSENFTVQCVRTIKDVSSVFQTFSAGLSGILLADKLENIGWCEVLKKIHKDTKKIEVPIFLIADKIPSVWNGVEEIISPPYENKMICRRVQNVIELYEQRKEFRQWFINQNHQMERQERRLADSQAMLLHALATIIDSKPKENSGHAGRVSQYTKMLLEQVMIERPECGLTHTDVEIISAAAAVYNIGKLVIQDFLLRKNGICKKKERNKLKAKEFYDYKVLNQIDRMEDTAYYHYCMDLSFYPNQIWNTKKCSSGSQDDEIPLGVQAAGMADVYDILTQEQRKQKTYSHEEAVKMIEDGECGNYSAFLLSCFRKVAPQFPYYDP